MTWFWLGWCGAWAVCAVCVTWALRVPPGERGEDGRARVGWIALAFLGIAVVRLLYGNGLAR